MIYSMEITSSARKHGYSDEEILHAWEQRIREVEFETYGEERILAIGPDWSGALLELVVVPVDEPTRIIHADLLRPKFYDYLR
jgi:uncharacterized DUF497 family protein